ncbi:hypothetical protein NQZ68_036669 [Dissostichus eleginoides]|nr:hypothetical protein NQZ68_036669 [Dissostichus eleginoides]
MQRDRKRARSQWLDQTVADEYGSKHLDSNHTPTMHDSIAPGIRNLPDTSHPGGLQGGSCDRASGCGKRARRRETAYPVSQAKNVYRTFRH